MFDYRIVSSLMFDYCIVSSLMFDFRIVSSLMFDYRIVSSLMLDYFIVSNCCSTSTIRLVTHANNSMEILNMENKREETVR
jgi:hypothetical protein